MDKQRVYKRIRDIAHELSNDKSTFTRADLAYELHDDGIEKDSSEIGRLVYEAYNFYKNDKAIKNAFYDNEIIQMTAGTTGYTPQFVREREKKI